MKVTKFLNFDNSFNWFIVSYYSHKINKCVKLIIRMTPWFKCLRVKCFDFTKRISLLQGTKYSP